MSFEKVWYTIPYHIRKLPGMSLALLDFYETIFEFWNNGQQCFLSNKLLMERTGIKSINTIHGAFQFFESNNVMKRVIKNNKRYVIQVLRAETECEIGEAVDKSPKNDAHPPSAVGGGGTTPLGGGGTSAVGDIINKTNINKLSKSFCDKAEKKKNKAGDESRTTEKTYSGKEDWKEANKKKHSWSEPNKAPTADVTKQSTSWNPEEHGKEINRSPEAVQKAMMSLPRNMRPKKYRDANPTDDNTKATELSTGTPVQSEIPTRSEPDEQGAPIDAGGGKDNPPPIRSHNGVVEARRVHSFLEAAGLAC